MTQEADGAMRRLQAMAMMKAAAAFLEQDGPSAVLSSLQSAVRALEAELAICVSTSASRH